jgi:hypothetical protein
VDIEINAQRYEKYILWRREKTDQEEHNATITAQGVEESLVEGMAFTRFLAPYLEAQQPVRSNLQVPHFMPSQSVNELEQMSHQMQLNPKR